MQSKNLGIIFYLKPIKDHDLYVKILSSNDKIISGLVYGGNSSKKKSIYQIGYFIEFNLLKKNSNSINSITAEIISPFIANIYSDKYKSFSLLAIISIINESLYEGDSINGLYLSLKDLIYSIISNQHWLSNLCKWLLYFLKLLGYEIDYNNKNDLKYFNLDTFSFQKTYTNQYSILFPYELLNNNCKLNYDYVNSLFIIFETVFKKNHLNNFKDDMPINYLNFKFLILNKLQNIK